MWTRWYYPVDPAVLSIYVNVTPGEPDVKMLRSFQNGIEETKQRIVQLIAQRTNSTTVLEQMNQAIAQEQVYLSRHENILQKLMHRLQPRAARDLPENSELDMEQTQVLMDRASTKQLEVQAEKKRVESNLSALHKQRVEFKLAVQTTPHLVHQSESEKLKAMKLTAVEAMMDEQQAVLETHLGSIRRQEAPLDKLYAFLASKMRGM
jgi:uncharacterized coiled-coil protein SlyX